MAEFLAPATLEGALEELRQPGTIAVGGGTQVGLLLRHGMLQPQRLVWLGQVSELHGVRAENGSLAIGGGTTLAEIATTAQVRQLHPMLAEAAVQIGNPRVRAVATLGGHLAHADPRQDLPPVLLALEASILVQRDRSQREISAQDFFTGPFETVLDEDELVTVVRIPPGSPKRRSRYVRFTPGSESDYATVGVAVSLELEAGTVIAARLALCGVHPRPLGLDLVQLHGHQLDDRAFEIAAEAVAQACDPVADQRGSAAYKRAMAALWTRRVLRQLADGGG
jgi:carbon-monoxide dehydrogenase medium subunit